MQVIRQTKTLAYWFFSGVISVTAEKGACRWVGDSCRVVTARQAGKMLYRVEVRVSRFVAGDPGDTEAKSEANWFR